MALARLLLALTLLASTSLAHDRPNQPWVTASTLERYDHFARYFNQTLAGRYPFGGPDSPDASPATVRDFLRNQAPQIADLRRAVAESEPGEWMRTVVRFLDQLADTAEFLDAVLGPSPAVRLHIEFNQPADQAIGTEQLIQWRFSSGVRSIDHPSNQSANDRSLNWTVGQPIVLDFFWAERSQFRPRPDSVQPPLTAKDRVASLVFSGEWALLRLLRSNTRTVKVSRGETPDFHRIIVSIPTDKSTDSSAAPTAALLQAPLLLQTTHDDVRTARERQLVIPTDWPQVAPSVDSRTPTVTGSSVSSAQRLLRIEAPTADDPTYRRQAALLLAAWNKLLERGFVVETRFGAPTFSVVLLGKDGAALLRRSVPLTPEKLFSTVDAMQVQHGQVAR